MAYDHTVSLPTQSSSDDEGFTSYVSNRSLVNLTVSVPSSYSWTIQGGVPDDIVEIPSGNTDRVQYKLPGTVETGFRTQWNWFGETTTVTVDSQTLWDNDFDSPSIIVNLNGTLNNSSTSTSLNKINNTVVAYFTQLIDVTVSADDYLDYDGSNLSTGGRGLNPRLHVLYTVKAA